MDRLSIIAWVVGVIMFHLVIHPVKSHYFGAISSSQKACIPTNKDILRCALQCEKPQKQPHIKPFVTCVTRCLKRWSSQDSQRILLPKYVQETDEENNFKP